MELQIAVEELLRALQRAQGIADKKTTMPILANVLLEAKKETLTVTAFDLEIGIQSDHPAEVIAQGRLAVSAKHLYDIVRSLSDASVVLKKGESNYIEITSGSAHFRLVALPADDFPALPKAEKVPFVRVLAKTLLDMLEKTTFAVSTDETRFNLNGVLFEAMKGSTRMVATDGHRLALVERPFEGDFKLKRGVILPKKGLHELKRILSEQTDSEAQVGFIEGSCVLKKPGLTLIMRLIDGHFPDYMNVLPKETSRSIRIGRTRLLETLKRVSLLSQDNAHTVKIETGEGTLKITSQNPDLGEAREDIAVEGVKPGLTVGFNAKYIIDVLQVVGTEEVRFELSDDLSPGVIKPLDDGSYTAVVMPVRI